MDRQQKTLAILMAMESGATYDERLKQVDAMRQIEPSDSSRNLSSVPMALGHDVTSYGFSTH
jgi:hypothetical protein